jgi:hypothetical protein
MTSYYLHNAIFIKSLAAILFISISFSKFLIKSLLKSKYSTISICFSIDGIGILIKFKYSFDICLITAPLNPFCNKLIFNFK